MNDSCDNHLFGGGLYRLTIPIGHPLTKEKGPSHASPSNLWGKRALLEGGSHRPAAVSAYHGQDTYLHSPLLSPGSLPLPFACPPPSHLLSWDGVSQSTLADSFSGSTRATGECFPCCVFIVRIILSINITTLQPPRMAAL